MSLEVSALEEDVLRRRQDALGSKKYTLCTACGCPMSRSRAVLVSGEVVGEARSEHSELCPDCAAAIEKGELIPPE